MSGSCSMTTSSGACSMSSQRDEQSMLSGCYGKVEGKQQCHPLVGSADLLEHHAASRLVHVASLRGCRRLLKDAAG